MTVRADAVSSGRGLRSFARRADILLVGVVLGGYLLAALVLFGFQRSLVFPADTSRADVAAVGLPDLKEITLTTADGETLVAWLKPPAEGKPLLLYFHGNAGNLGTPPRAARFRALTEDGTGLLAVSYRGYGGSTGAPGEAGLHQDALAAYREAARRYGADRIVLYGESLGTGVAIALAAEEKVRAVVLDAAYSSAVDVALWRYPIMLVRLLMFDTFDSDRRIGRVRAPILMMHGDADGIIPVEEGQLLYAVAPQPKRFVLFHGGHHSDLYRRGGAEQVRQFLADVATDRIGGQEVRQIGF